MNWKHPLIDELCDPFQWDVWKTNLECTQGGNRLCDGVRLRYCRKANQPPGCLGSAGLHSQNLGFRQGHAEDSNSCFHALQASARTVNDLLSCRTVWNVTFLGSSIILGIRFVKFWFFSFQRMTSFFASYWQIPASVIFPSGLKRKEINT